MSRAVNETSDAVQLFCGTITIADVDVDSATQPQAISPSSKLGFRLYNIILINITCLGFLWQDRSPDLLYIYCGDSQNSFFNKMLRYFKIYLRVFYENFIWITAIIFGSIDLRTFSILKHFVIKRIANMWYCVSLSFKFYIYI